MSDTISKATSADVASVQYWKERVREDVSGLKGDVQAERAAETQVATSMAKPRVPKI